MIVRLEKIDGGPPNAWRVTNADGTRVYGQAIRPTETDVQKEPWFMPAPGYMVQRSDELEAIAAVLRHSAELKP